MLPRNAQFVPQRKHIQGERITSSIDFDDMLSRSLFL
jgi:hypothetical protein